MSKMQHDTHLYSLSPGIQKSQPRRSHLSGGSMLHTNLNPYEDFESVYGWPRPRCKYPKAHNRTPCIMHYHHMVVQAALLALR